MKPRADEFEDFVDSYGNGLSIGTASTLGGDKPLPKNWQPPAREFHIGFHFAAPGPSHPEAAPPAAPKRSRSKAPAGAAKAPKPPRSAKA